ncbi:MAG: alpha/beta hydrolase [Acidobacteria bacterium]|nr:alpha/beta hydrolase [Acidobacteriota bacterium]
MTSGSDFIRIRGLRFHIRRWGADKAPKIFLLHGFLDVAGTWEPVAQALLPRFQVVAPDQRGFGHSEWPQDGYWFQDYVADFAAIADHYSPADPILLVGHSMGGQVASLYAGLQPGRVAKLVCLDSLFLRDMEMALAPKRFRAWLEDLKNLPRQKYYSSFEDLAGRIRKQHPDLSAERALFVARCWAREDGHGRISLCADPKHRLRGPGLYHVEESLAVWREITAPTLFVACGKSPFTKAITAEEIKRRRGCFRNHQEARIENGSHMLHFSAPEETARLVGDFLAS